MINFGTVRPGSLLTIPFDSYAGSTGASATLSGLATTDIKIYKDGSTTERASQAGFTLLDTDGIDFDGITGVNGFSVSLADNTTAGFYTSGSDYFIVVNSVTVDSQTVNFTVARFTIGYPQAAINTTIATLSNQTSFTLTAGPAEDDALNGMWAIIHDIASAVQLAKVLILDYTGSTKTVTLAAGATFTAAAGDNISIIDLAPLQPATTGRTLVVGTLGQADANIVQSAGTTAFNYDGTLLSVGTNTITFPAADALGNAIPQDGQYGAYKVVKGVGGLGVNTFVITGPSTGALSARTYTVLAGDESQFDSTTQYILSQSVASALAALTMTEEYPVAGAEANGAAILYDIMQQLGDFSNSGVTRTVKKRDGSTTAKTFTYDSATTPTSISETT